MPTRTSFTAAEGLVSTGSRTARSQSDVHPGAPSTMGDVPVLRTRWGRARLWLVYLRSDALLRNSFFILLTTATMGGVGFLFWLVNARLFTSSQIGVATTLISATALICYLSLLGFDATFIRFLPRSSNRDAEINTGLILVLGAALVVSTAYVLAAPIFVPALRFVRASPLYAIGFVVLTAFAAVNLVTDSVFIAYRGATYNFIVDGLLQGAAKLALPALLTGLGAYGIFAASGGAAGGGLACDLV